MVGAYINALVGYARLKIVVALGLMLLLGLTEGIGLLMLVPFLELVGVTSDAGAGGDSAALTRKLLGAVGLPLTLHAILCVFVGLIVLRALLARWRDILLTDIRLGFVDHLRIRLYSAIGHARWAFLSKRRTADFTHALTADVDRVGEGTYFLLALAVAAVVATVHITAAFLLSALMTVIALGTGGVLLLTLRPQIRRTRRLGEKLTEANRNVYRAVTEFLSGLKLAKSHALEERHCQIFHEAVRTCRKRALSFKHRTTLAQVVYQAGAAVALSGLLCIAVEMLELPGPELLVLVLVFARLLPMLSRMQLCYQAMVHGLPALAAIMEMIKSCDKAFEYAGGGNEQVSLRHELQLQGVSFSYDDQPLRAALKGIDLIIPARRTTALVGCSGAGKSTLADLLMGLLAPDRGRILLDGTLLRSDMLRAWRRCVAYVPQETFLFHDTVRANLRWATPETDDAEIWRILRLVAADDFVADLPSGLDTVVGDRGVRLSGGERQRLALARALLCRPSLLILDEATSALDAEHERRIQRAIDDLHGELTLVVIAHRLSTVRHSDQIIVLDRGRIVEVGDWHELTGRSSGRLSTMVAAANGGYAMVYD